MKFLTDIVFICIYFYNQNSINVSCTEKWKTVELTRFNVQNKLIGGRHSEEACSKVKQLSEGRARAGYGGGRRVGVLQVLV